MAQPIPAWCNSGKHARQNWATAQAHDTKESLLASQACTQCDATKDNRRAIINTALDAEAILRADALLYPLQPAYEPLRDAGNAGIRQLGSRK